MAADRANVQLALARDLEQRDADVAVRIESAAAALRLVDALRARAGHVHAGLETIPAAIAEAEVDERDARERSAAAGRELVEAERRLDQARGSRRAREDAKDQAERGLRRASVAATDAADGTRRARQRLEALVRDEAALQAEGEGLAVEAGEVARRVAEVPRLSESGRSVPGSSLPEIDEWAARAHAALFVVRGGLESERERLVLEANGLAASALGDDVGGSSVALVRRRIEQALGRGSPASG